MRDDHRNKVREILARAKQAADSRNDTKVTAQTERASLERSYDEQWRDVIAPTLREFADELTAGGHRATVTHTPELRSGGLRIDPAGYETLRNFTERPSLRFSLADDTNAVAVEFDYSVPGRKEKPERVTHAPQELTADKVSALIVELLDRSIGRSPSLR
jgi:hypothetical protein